VVLGNDGLVYACDRPNNRIQAFKKTCAVPSDTSAKAPDNQPLCLPEKIIYIKDFRNATEPNREVILRASTRACDMDFWPNKDTLASASPTSQRYIVDVDLGNDNTWVLDRTRYDPIHMSMPVVGQAGRCGQAPCPGHNAGDFAFGHTVNVAPDNRTIYVAETITGRRIQKFVRADDDDDEDRDRDRE
jgi:hypothetical protein